MRSNFEKAVALYLKRHRVSFDYEPYNVGYYSRIASGSCATCGSKDVHKRRNYRPDFVLANGIYLESKGRLTSAERTKILEILNTSQLITRDNYRLLFMGDKRINKNSDTRYSDWAAKNGIVFHVSPKGEVPKQWLKKKQ